MKIVNFNDYCFAYIFIVQQRVIITLRLLFKEFGRRNFEKVVRPNYISITVDFHIGFISIYVINKQMPLKISMTMT